VTVMFFMELQSGGVARSAHTCSIWDCAPKVGNYLQGKQESGVIEPLGGLRIASLSLEKHPSGAEARNIVGLIRHD
jgi:hypothetical protein